MGPYFAVFIGAWIYLRHYLNLVILYSEFNEFKTVGPYELNWETEQYKCELSHWISTFLLGCLQALNLFWLYHIIRIAYRFAVTTVVIDDRSDEDSEEEEEQQKILASAGVDKLSSQKILANGNGKTTAAEVHTDVITNRKENKA